MIFGLPALVFYVGGSRLCRAFGMRRSGRSLRHGGGRRRSSHGTAMRPTRTASGSETLRGPRGALVPLTPMSRSAEPVCIAGKGAGSITAGEDKSTGLLLARLGRGSYLADTDEQGLHEDGRLAVAAVVWQDDLP